MSEYVGITLNLPADIHRRLQAVAEASGWAFEEVLLQTIRVGMPPSLKKVPVTFHRLLLEMNQLPDKQLMDFSLGDWEQADSSTEAEKAGISTLRRAYAYALLRWRGHPVPDPSEFLL